MSLLSRDLSRRKHVGISTPSPSRLDGPPACRTRRNVIDEQGTTEASQVAATDATLPKCRFRPRRQRPRRRMRRGGRGFRVGGRRSLVPLRRGTRKRRRLLCESEPKISPASSVADVCRYDGVVQSMYAPLSTGLGHFAARSTGNALGQRRLTSSLADRASDSEVNPRRTVLQIPGLLSNT